MDKYLIKIVTLIGLFVLMTCTHTYAQEEDDDAKYATELLKVGTVVPNFTLNTPDGTPISLSDYKGKFVVLDFWASWCPDCRKDAPIIVAAHQQYKDKGVAFIGISFDTAKENWEAAIEKYSIQYPQVSELKKWHDTTISEMYHIKWIPSMYLIDPEGKVVLATVLSEKLLKKLSEVVK